MARPQKNNADYFPHDANMRDDPKIKALRARYALTGYAIWCILLETLTDANNFAITWDELNIELTAGDMGIEAKKLVEIVEYMQKLQLIQTSDGKLYTTRHHDRMRPILDERERKRQWKQQNSGKATEKTNQNEISDGENAQSKVKETKGNQSKLNPSNEGESNARAHEAKPQNQKNEPPTPTPQPSNGGGDTVSDFYTKINDYCNTDDGLRELITWKKQAGYSDRTHGPTTGELTKFISKYLPQMRNTDPIQYYRDHFAAWLVRATEYNRTRKDAPPKYTPPPPHQRQPRTNGNATGLTTIGDITGKIITEIA